VHLQSSTSAEISHFIGLISTVKATLGDASHSAEERIRRAEDILKTVPLPSVDRGIGDSRRTLTRGGLAPWQTRKLELLIADRLSLPITCRDMAQWVGLSPSHFSRAFRTSVKVTPHVYVMRARVERACVMMKSSPAALSQISIECGFSDQAHFNRVFRSLVGLSPGRWRRMQCRSNE